MEENLKFIRGTTFFLLPVGSNQLSHLLKLSTYFTLSSSNPRSPLVPNRNTAVPNRSSTGTPFVIIRDDKTEIVQILSRTVQLEEPKFQLYQRRSTLWVSDWKVETHNCKSGKLVTSGTRRKAPALPEDFQLRSMFSTLRKVEGLQA